MTDDPTYPADAMRQENAEARHWKARHDDLAAALAALADVAEEVTSLIATEPWDRGWRSAHQKFRRDLRALLADPAAVLADRDRRVKAEATADALTVAAVLLRRVFDYWEGRPISMHAGHLWDDFRGVLTAIERDAEHNRREGGRA